MNHFFPAATTFYRSSQRPIAIIFCTLIALTAGLEVFSRPVLAMEKYWVDPATGFAMGGYDVVSYWSSRGPVLGTEEYEVEIEKVTWRFSNQGNYEEFLKFADVYAPQFSGYGAYAVSQGKAPRGNPNIWEIADNKLYFFYSRQSKIKWQQTRKKSIRKAIEQWPALKRQIARPN